MRTFKFELSEEMLGVVSRVLAAQPYHVVAQTVAEIQRQVNEQSRPTPIRDENVS